MTFICEVLCVGNELLIGKTLNTNAHWLCGQLAALGGIMRRITTVPDEIDSISQAFSEISQRKPSLLLMTGGLGPTSDDKSLVAVSCALNVPLILDEAALRMVTEAVGRLGKGRDTNTAEFKQAHIPFGSVPLANDVGTAPGVRIQIGEMVAFVLPGVPSEMTSIFKRHIIPYVRSHFQTSSFHQHSITVRGVRESLLAPLIAEFTRRHPSICFKSHPSPERRSIEVHLSTQSDEVTRADLVKISGELERRVSKLGVA